MSDPKWMDIARGYLGVREYTEQRPGPDGELSNPQIEAWQNLAGMRHVDDLVPWCAAFVTGVMHEAGYSFATSAARAWARFGSSIEDPKIGCIVVLWRDNPHGPHGHVGFCTAWDATTITLLAGNTGNAVKVARFPRARVLSYRWPPALP